MTTAPFLCALAALAAVHLCAAGEATCTTTTRGDDARLPTDLLPVRYEIQLQPYIFVGNFTTAGHVAITLNCTQPTDVIVVNINDMEVTVADVTDVDSNATVAVASTVHDPALQMLSVQLGAALQPGRVYQLRLDFLGQLNDLLQGFYRSSYVEPVDNEIRWLASTQFSPTDARRAFPCLDEPAFKAVFQISIARQEHLRTHSNMPLAQTVPVDGQPGWVWDIYPDTLPMSTYLVAFIVSDLAGVDAASPGNTPPGFPFKVWSREEALDQTEYAGSVGPRMLNFLEEYFSIPFPMPKMDMVAIPDFGFNAMENWGLITFRESAMLYDANVSTEVNKQATAYVIGHELGHQWFGNLVTPEWWNDLWLKEGFATFLGYVATEFVESTWRMLDQFQIEKLHRVFRLDALESSHPISVPVDHPDEIRQIFDSISYDKGASIIRMMNHFLGEATFRAGLTDYLDALKYRNARQEDLWGFLTTQAHEDASLPAHMTVQLVMDTWTLQTGYPVVTVARDYAGGTGTMLVTQERFLLSGRASVDESVRNVTWWVPLTYTASEAPDFENTLPRVWMENTAAITITHDIQNTSWILFNVKETGYYRVNYDTDNWRLLTADFSLLLDVAQAQLLDDSLCLAAGNYLPYDTALTLVSHLGSNTDYFPWSAAFSNLVYVDHMLAFTVAYNNYKVFVLSTMNLLYATLGFEESPSDSHLDILNRVTAVRAACQLEQDECVTIAAEKFNDWMNDKNVISVNQKSVVYCTAIGRGGEQEWQFAWGKYISTNSVSERTTLLSALGCSRDPATLQSYLEMTLSNSSNIRKQDGATVFSSVASNMYGHQIAFDFLRSNFVELQNYYGSAFSTVSKMVSSLGTYMNTREQLAELEALRDENIDQLGTTERSFNQTIEKVEANIRWMEDNYAEVEQWLIDRVEVYDAS